MKRLKAVWIRGAYRLHCPTCETHEVITKRLPHDAAAIHCKWFHQKGGPLTTWGAA